MPGRQSSRWSTAILVIVVVALVPWVASAQDAGAPTAASAPGSATRPPAPAPSSPATEELGPEAPKRSAAVENLWLLERNIHALMLNRLDVAVDASSLFDVDLDDEEAVQVEVSRLRRLLYELPPPPSPPLDPSAAPSAVPSAVPSASASASVPAPPPPPPPPADAADPDLLEARLAVDAVRLRFYELSPDARGLVLDGHRTRQSKGAADQARKELSEAEQEQQRARLERERAQKELAAARSEAAKRLGSERVRLLEIRESQADLAAELAKEKVELAGFSEQQLAWQRPADDVLRAPLTKRPDPRQVDTVYDELTRNLAQTRERLDEAIAALGETPESLKVVGEDTLTDLPADVDRSKVDMLRTHLIEEETKLLRTFEEQQWERMRQLMAAMEGLDKRRLELLPRVSDAKRSKLSGFTAQAFEQAGAEVTQVLLVLRYHLLETRRFVTNVRETGDTEGSAFTATVTALKWLFPIGFFVWWRRRAEQQLRAWKRAAVEAARKKRQRGRTRVERVLKFYARIRNPFEWLVLVWAVFFLFPDGAGDLLEVELVRTALTWMLGGQLVVRAIDAWFDEDGKQRKSRLQTAALRFRTLRLLGRAVVTFGLVLALTSKLVGPGTIYEWVWTVCFLSILPIFLLVLRWWRDVIFHYTEVQRKKGSLLKWVESNQTGWKSFPAAIAGGGYLLGSLVLKFVRVYVLGFDIVKRILAYWFRREVEKKSESRTSSVQDVPIDEALYDAFDPEIQAADVVASIADKQVDEVIARINEPGGAVFALVGERGSGKTTLLRRINEKTPDTQLIRCPVGGIAAFHAALREALELDEDAEDEAVIELLNKRAGDNAMLVDDAQYLLRPVVDGLEELDRLIALARRSSKSCTWVFAFDNVIWQFFKRAREVRPLFDDIVQLHPWTEEGIVRLLGRRSEQVELEPDFSRLVGELPPDADEIDVEEALERARSGFYRLLWDYSLGNPAVSLHFWRESLRVGPDGNYIVRLFEPPDTSDLERLPDSAVFVLRAVIQLERAAVDDVVEATMLARRQVDEAVQYALTRGYLEEVDGHLRIRWKWFRTITRFLLRRHLLSSPYQS